MYKIYTTVKKFGVGMFFNLNHNDDKTISGFFDEYTVKKNCMYLE